MCPWCSHTFVSAEPLGTCSGTGRRRPAETAWGANPWLPLYPVLVGTNGDEAGKGCAKKKKKDKGGQVAADTSRGRLQENAASLLMQVLHVARMAGFGFAAPQMSFGVLHHQVEKHMWQTTVAVDKIHSFHISPSASRLGR